MFKHYLDRRRFLEAAGAAVMTTAAASPNDSIRLGVIGCGGRGRQVLKEFASLPGVAVPVLCDADQTQSAKANQSIGGKAECFQDYRRVLERKDVDAVLIATPDHWHAIVTILACQAGKDVYLEKPASHTIAEGRLAVEAARKHNRIVQVGTQQLSGEHYRLARQLIQDGKLGKITYVKCWNVGNSSPGRGFPEDQTAPATLDWDLWLGPAAAVPFNPVRLRSWRWFWEYGNGTEADWGTHHLGSIHQLTGQDRPLSVAAAGGRLAIRDMLQTPDTMTAVFEYPGNWLVELQVREANGYSADHHNYGIRFHGTNGTLFLNRSGFEVFPEKERMPALTVGQPQDQNAEIGSMNRVHVENFLASIRSRELPAGDIEIGHRATSACLLANIALRTGHKVVWDAQSESITGDPAATALLRQHYRKPYELPKV
jgi:predicted dehydrogenase